MNAEPLLLWTRDEEGVYSTKRTPGTRRLPVPITSFQNVKMMMRGDDVAANDVVA